MDFLKSQQGKSAKNGRLPKKAAIIHKIPEFVGVLLILDDDRFHLKGNAKENNLLPLFII
ncbi:hypothetical protein K7G95_02635 [Escherichia coli]|nr:hypothetical protein [Escherichia coli]MDW9206964.1 hypothetical protein [Escherichia coli]QZY50058.1 hypothetical protein K7G95_02635 [Escherichia coli]